MGLMEKYSRAAARIVLCSYKVKFVVLCLFIGGSILASRVSVYVQTGQQSVVSVPTYLNQPLPFSKDIPLIRYFDKRGFDLPTELLPNKTDLWTRNVQLCIMFNSVHSTRTIGLLLSYYLQIFNHITLLVSQTDLEYNTKPHSIPAPVNVLNCNSYYGWYQQKCLSLCLQNPASLNVEGFLYIADDMFVNLTKMSQLDRSKLWMIPIESYNYTKLLTMNSFSKLMVWPWFGFPKFSEHHLQKTIQKLPNGWIKALQRNAGFPDNYAIHSPFDITYIPKSLSSQMIEIISFISNTTDLFCEVAGPLAVGIITHPSQRELLINGYLWYWDRRLSRKEAMAKTAHFVHPIKLGHSEDSKLWTKLMKIQLRDAGYIWPCTLAKFIAPPEAG